MTEENGSLQVELKIAGRHIRDDTPGLARISPRRAGTPSPVLLNRLVESGGLALQLCKGN